MKISSLFKLSLLGQVSFDVVQHKTALIVENRWKAVNHTNSYCFTNATIIRNCVIDTIRNFIIKLIMNIALPYLLLRNIRCFISVIVNFDVVKIRSQTQIPVSHPHFGTHSHRRDVFLRHTGRFNVDCSRSFI